MLRGEHASQFSTLNQSSLNLDGPKPNADLWMRVELPLDKKTMENQDWATGSRAVGHGPLGRCSHGPPGRGAVAGRGPRTAGPSGSRAAGPLQPWAAGPAFSKTLFFCP